MPDESATQRLRFAWLVAGTFVALSIPRLALHELWRDEAWMWLVVLDSPTLHDMASVLARNGEGYLFPVLCFLAKLFTASPRAMQCVNLVLAGSGAFVFARWAPFSRTVRVLFLLGYFPFYEYAILSRHYVAGGLFLWLACAAARRQRPAAFGAALGLLCQTTVYGYILALALAGGWCVDRFVRRREVVPLPRRDLAVGLACAMAGGAAGLVQLIPAEGTSFAPGWRLHWDPAIAVRVLQAPWKGLAPLVRPELHFWNSNLLDGFPGAEALAGGLLLGGVVLFLRPRKVALATFLIGASGLLGFAYIKLIGQARHDGHWWLLAVAALWLDPSQPRPDDRRTWRPLALLALLGLHAASGAFASVMDLRHPFSNAAATAERLRTLGLEDSPLFGYREPPAASVSLPLGRALWSPARGIFARFPDWGPLQRDLDEQELRCAARDFARREGRDVTLVMNRELQGWREASELAAIVGAIVPSEDYHLYRLRFDLLEETAPEARCPGVASAPQTERRAIAGRTALRPSSPPRAPERARPARTPG